MLQIKTSVFASAQIDHLDVVGLNSFEDIVNILPSPVASQADRCG
jgi:hypothetical protein